MVNFEDHFYHKSPLHVSKSHFESRKNAKFLHPKRKLSQRRTDIRAVKPQAMGFTRIRADLRQSPFVSHRLTSGNAPWLRALTSLKYLL